MTAYRIIRILMMDEAEKRVVMEKMMIAIGFRFSTRERNMLGEETLIGEHRGK